MLFILFCARNAFYRQSALRHSIHPNINIINDYFLYIKPTKLQAINGIYRCFRKYAIYSCTQCIDFSQYV